VIDKLYYLIYFDLLSYSKLDKLNGILTHYENLSDISQINREDY